MDMDMEEFIKALDKINYGVVAFNTYRLDNENHCYIMIAERGATGRFIKNECKATELNVLLGKIIDDIHIIWL